MAKKYQRAFTKEFKLQALKLAAEMGSIAEAAKSLDISESVLYAWKSAVSKEGSDAFPGKGKLLPEAAKLMALETELRKLKMENDFLKKGAGAPSPLILLRIRNKNGIH